MSNGKFKGKPEAKEDQLKLDAHNIEYSHDNGYTFGNIGWNGNQYLIGDAYVFALFWLIFIAVIIYLS